MILAWSSVLLPWQHCLAACHNRVAVSGHECHPGGRCSWKPGHEDTKTQDERLSFDSGPEPASMPVPSVQPAVAVAAAAAIEAARAADAPPAVPRTTVLLL